MRLMKPGMEGLQRLASRILYLILLLGVSWGVMTFTHETGHIVGGWMSGGTLKSVDLLPWHLPYSIFDPDPEPLVTLWCGPMLGVLVPFGLALLIRRDWMWFIAHFCMLANGVYLAMAWVSGGQYLDTPKLLETGAHPITIVIYCVVTIGMGYIGFRGSCIRVLAASPRRSGNAETDENAHQCFPLAEQSDRVERSG